MHTYLRVDNDGIVGVRGLKGCEFVDKVRECQGQEERDVVDVTCNEDRVYKDVKEDVVVDLGRERQIIIKRFNYSDIVLWNPWQEKARDMSDFDDDEYKQMVCVEPGTVSKPIKLGPGQTWVAGQLLRLAPTAY
ncbi:hypothetical protein EV182_008518 [Spiromyces aspiralis]|uniref:Uncharacterized protein n=1 Tax=Spiromyces aspiralis TaxID=68401 RepID=A0ACC1HKR6_9FUNG|nr:hypothetical protein EV182_008518 [Spiromyces aspiralis]